MLLAMRLGIYELGKPAWCRGNSPQQPGASWKPCALTSQYACCPCNAASGDVEGGVQRLFESGSLALPLLDEAMQEAQRMGGGGAPQEALQV